MKVWVYRADEGPMTVLVQASPGKGKAPVVLGGITPQNVVEKVLPAVTAMRLPKPPQLPLPG